MLGLRYPGGPNIEACARGGRPIVPMPKMLKGGGGFDFSYSGLKTAVINYCHTKEQKGEEYSKADVAASFQCAAIDVLVEKTVLAAKAKGVTTVTAGRRRRGEYLFAGKPEIRLRGEGLPPGSARKAPLHGQRGHDRVRGADSVPPRQFCGARSQRQGFHSLAKLPVRTIRKL